jgi:hypothetical protein
VTTTSRPTGATRAAPLLASAAAGDAEAFRHLTEVTHAPFAVKVLTVHGHLISAITGFVTPHLFPAFALPATILSARVPGSA